MNSEITATLTQSAGSKQLSKVGQIALKKNDTPASPSTSQVSARESEPVNYARSGNDQVSISGSVKAEDVSTKENVPVADKKPFESTPVANSTVSFKTTKNNQLIMQVIDNETDKVIKQYPPEELQKVTQALDSFLEAQKPENGENISDVA